MRDLRLRISRVDRKGFFNDLHQTFDVLAVSPQGSLQILGPQILEPLLSHNHASQNEHCHHRHCYRFHIASLRQATFLRTCALGVSDERLELSDERPVGATWDCFSGARVSETSEKGNGTRKAQKAQKDLIFEPRSSSKG